MSIVDTVKQAATGVMVKLTPPAPPPPGGGGPPPGGGGGGARGGGGPRKGQGQARFAAEGPAEAMTYAALLYSTVARGRIVALDTAAAEAAPGVVFVMTYRNAMRLNPPAMFLSDPRAAGALVTDRRSRGRSAPTTSR